MPGIHSCWTLEDGRNIVNRAQPGSNVVLMGAGFIGCIILEALALRKVNLTVIEMGDRMVPRMMDQTAGNMIKKWCQEKGVAVHTSTRVDAIEKGSGDSLKVKLDNGDVLDADLVISATGVAANIQFLEGSGLKQILVCWSMTGYRQTILISMLQEMFVRARIFQPGSTAYKLFNRLQPIMVASLR